MKINLNNLAKTHPNIARMAANRKCGETFRINDRGWIVDSRGDCYARPVVDGVVSSFLARVVAAVNAM